MPKVFAWESDEFEHVNPANGVQVPRYIIVVVEVVVEIVVVVLVVVVAMDVVVEVVGKKTQTPSFGTPALLNAWQVAGYKNVIDIHTMNKLNAISTANSTIF